MDELDQAWHRQQGHATRGVGLTVASLMCLFLAGVGLEFDSGYKGDGPFDLGLLFFCPAIFVLPFTGVGAVVSGVMWHRLRSKLDLLERRQRQAAAQAPELQPSPPPSGAPPSSPAATPGAPAGAASPLLGDPASGAWPPAPPAEQQREHALARHGTVTALIMGGVGSTVSLGAFNLFLGARRSVGGSEMSVVLLLACLAAGLWGAWQLFQAWRRFTRTTALEGEFPGLRRRSPALAVQAAAQPPGVASAEVQLENARALRWLIGCVVSMGSCALAGVVLSAQFEQGEPGYLEEILPTVALVGLASGAASLWALTRSVQASARAAELARWPQVAPAGDDAS